MSGNLLKRRQNSLLDSLNRTKKNTKKSVTLQSLKTMLQKKDATTRDNTTPLHRPSNNFHENMELGVLSCHFAQELKAVSYLGSLNAAI